MKMYSNQLPTVLTEQFVKRLFDDIAENLNVQIDYFSFNDDQTLCNMKFNEFEFGLMIEMNSLIDLPKYGYHFTGNVITKNIKTGTTNFIHTLMPIMEILPDCIIHLNDDMDFDFNPNSILPNDHETIGKTTKQFGLDLWAVELHGDNFDDMIQSMVCQCEFLYNGGPYHEFKQPFSLKHDDFNGTYTLTINLHGITKNEFTHDGWIENRTNDIIIDHISHTWQCDYCTVHEMSIDDELQILTAKIDFNHIFES